MRDNYREIAQITETHERNCYDEMGNECNYIYTHTKPQQQERAKTRPTKRSGTTKI